MKKSRFRLSTLFIVVTLCAGLFGLGSWHLWWVPKQEIKEVLASLESADHVRVDYRTWPRAPGEVNSYSIFSGGGRNLTHLFDLDVWPTQEQDEKGQVIIRASNVSAVVVPDSPAAERILTAIRRAQPAGIPPPDIRLNRQWLDELTLDLEQRLQD